LFIKYLAGANMLSSIFGYYVQNLHGQNNANPS